MSASSVVCVDAPQFIKKSSSVFQSVLELQLIDGERAREPGENVSRVSEDVRMDPLEVDGANPSPPSSMYPATSRSNSPDGL
ncbi:hypothetical protein GCK72_008913 [Caenorhabditis remanei]|uniref:Uncharacterized protein n=1 Tax=Caenorhabditis remanei TaxID=31234 RepID=A0A6A5H1L6_CAERE|nr:hypothetical protein GCK72_008913 [Caenorhabditis remanei]KAF1760664.1 hypothetical protein GCK72_008913 [Caenorhabditis remanei]